MQMEAGLDTGPILATAETPINADTTTGVLHKTLAALSAKLLVEKIDDIGNLLPRNQAADGVIYAKKISKSESEISWDQSAIKVKNHIHGLSPFPGAWSTFRGERIKFHQVEIIEKTGAPGSVLSDEFAIGCGDGSAIKPLIIQREGKKSMPAKDVLRGLEFNIGDYLGDHK